ncbi:MAG: hypothetical protein H0T79_00040 [Deltaproteobacteria bacterium]|nr:hypothetical protein [Deltaproteobacteria bacterium]
MRALVLGLFAGCSAAAPPPAAPVAAPMASFEINGYLLAGAEYWPYAGTADIDYPKDVLWGFYPEKGVTAPGETDPNADAARPAAIACAQQAFTALRAFVTSDPARLRRIVGLGKDQGYVPRFFLWTNDYTRAATPYPPGVREARLWYWKRKTPDPARPPGYWKWESTLDQRGECHVPQPAQIEQYLTETLATVERS